MPIKLNTASGGGVILTGANTASDKTITIPAADTTMVGTDSTQTLTNKTIQGGVVTSGTAVSSTSGTAIDFTGIPSWAKRITVMFNGVSTNGTSFVIVQVGSGSVSTSGYASTSGWINDVGSVSLTAQTAGFGIFGNTSAYSRNGLMTLSLIASNTWVSSHALGGSYSGTFFSANGGGVSPALGGALDRVRITTVNGTDTFDAGSINILYEG